MANLGSASVAVVDVSDPEAARVIATLSTDPHPNDLAITGDGRLFVSCGHTNNVISFDLKTRERLEVLNTALSAKAPAGSTPNSLALSPGGDRLYVANADNNSVAVIDVEERGKSKVLGFLPTGWYPTFVTTSPTVIQTRRADADGGEPDGRQQRCTLSIDRRESLLAICRGRTHESAVRAVGRPVGIPATS